MRLSDDRHEFRAMVRRFVTDELDPLVPASDADERMPLHDVFSRLAELGLLRRRWSAARSCAIFARARARVVTRAAIAGDRTHRYTIVACPGQGTPAKIEGGKDGRRGSCSPAGGSSAAARAAARDGTCDG